MLVHPKPTMSKHRVDAFSDGVFAIACTLLVLNLHIPELTKNASSSELWHALLIQWPRLFSFIISFAVIAIFWMGHHIVMHYVRRVDRMFLNINSLYLLLIAFIPFVAGLIGEHGTNVVAQLIYGTTLIMTSLALAYLWHYSSHHHRLVDADLNSNMIHLATKMLLIGPVFFLIALGFAFINTRVSIWFYVIVPLLYVVAGPVDRIMAMDTRESIDQE